MEANQTHLRTSIIAALTILRHDTMSLEARVQDAEAALLAALVYCDAHTPEEAAPEAPEPALPGIDAALADMEQIDRFHPEPRQLSAYRQERGMRIPAFTAFLGIAHHEYAAIVRRCPSDRRLRDQIAFKLGVAWQAIAEFMPEPPPQPRSQPLPLPPREGAKPPSHPWYLVDEETGQVLSGPHTDPLPANAVYLGDPRTWEPSNLVVLHDYSACTEEDQLPAEGFSAKEREAMYADWDAFDEAIAALNCADLDELMRVHAHGQGL